MKAIAMLAAVVLLSGCATAPRGAKYEPIVDMKGKDEAVYVTDLAECQQYATKTMDAAQGAVAGAAVAGVIGAILAPRSVRTRVVGSSAALGAAGGAGRAVQTQEGVIKQCLAGRGYNVLN